MRLSPHYFYQYYFKQSSLPIFSVSLFIGKRNPFYYQIHSWQVLHHIHFFFFFHKSAQIHLKISQVSCPTMPHIWQPKSPAYSFSAPVCNYFFLSYNIIFYIRILLWTGQQPYFLSIFIFTESHKTRTLISYHKPVSPFPRYLEIYLCNILV